MSLSSCLFYRMGSVVKPTVELSFTFCELSRNKMEWTVLNELETLERTMKLWKKQNNYYEKTIEKYMKDKPNVLWMLKCELCFELFIQSKDFCFL